MHATPAAHQELSRTERLLGRLPRGDGPDERVWAARHRGIVKLLWLHAVGLPLLSLAHGDEVLHALLHGAGLAVPALAATRLGGRLVRAVIAAFGLLTASALLVHVTGGLTEAHFHFFVMMSVVTLYEDWRTFLLAFGYVVAHHGALGTLVPHEVFGHASASVAAWKLVALHGGFVLAAGVANVVAWRANETAAERRSRRERDRADAAQRRLATLVESTDDAVIGMTIDGTVETWNPGAERLFGRTAGEMLGGSVLKVVPAELRAQELELMARVARDGRLDHFETVRLRADGSELEISLTLSLVRDGARGEPGLVAIARDITDRKRREREREAEAGRLQVLAHADHLTGLGNRRRFDLALEDEITRSRRDEGGFALVLFDLDGFKGVNDTLGHAEGDRVLQVVAELLRERRRAADVACRLGGDEFALLLPGADRPAARAVAGRIRAGLCELRDDVDVSSGVALWPEDAATADELIAHADTGMYAAKARRRGRRRPARPSARRATHVG